MEEFDNIIDIWDYLDDLPELDYSTIFENSIDIDFDYNDFSFENLDDLKKQLSNLIKKRNRISASNPNIILDYNKKIKNIEKKINDFK